MGLGFEYCHICAIRCVSLPLMNYAKYFIVLQTFKANRWNKFTQYLFISF